MTIQNEASLNGDDQPIDDHEADRDSGVLRTARRADAASEFVRSTRTYLQRAIVATQSLTADYEMETSAPPDARKLRTLARTLRSGLAHLECVETEIGKKERR